ncbi:hypothetical protein [Pedobacter gandavensis]|uniref:hypothetical protein n=1 Tax=Pedobacter gandavensis TaxID=2679963 RepID=UPI0029309C1C|nr:hypothetical protein [Pedobacter gandavensis]
MNQTNFDFSHKYAQFITEFHAAMNYRDSRGYVTLNPENKLEDSFTDLFVNYYDQPLPSNHRYELDDATLAYYYFCSSTGQHLSLKLILQKLGNKFIKKCEKRFNEH